MFVIVWESLWLINVSLACLRGRHSWIFPAKKITLSRIQKCTGRIVSWKMLQDVERCWKMLKDVERPGHGFGSEKIHHHSLPVAHRLNPRRNLREHWRRREPWTGSSVVESSHPPVGWGNVVKPRETTWNLVLLKSSQISLAFWFISRLSRYVSLSLRSKQPVALKIRNMSEGVFLTLNQVVLTRRSS